MDNNPSINIAKKEIQKKLLNELCNKGLIDFTNTSNIIKRLDEDIYNNSKENIETIVKYGERIGKAKFFTRIINKLIK